jgi:hypothetical protein
MEQRAVIRFFTFKWLKARVTDAELESVYSLEAFDRPTVKKWGNPFSKGSGSV